MGRRDDSPPKCRARVRITALGVEFVAKLDVEPTGAQTIRIRIGGLLTRDGTPWHEQTRDGWVRDRQPRPAPDEGRLDASLVEDD
jgi:hypothetical protein